MHEGGGEGSVWRLAKAVVLPGGGWWCCMAYKGICGGGVEKTANMIAFKSLPEEISVIDPIHPRR